ncbi:MAG: ABC transporter permease [Terriglobia bacterium]|jgi:predicted permease
MPEWKEEVSRRLASLKLAPAREAEIVEELAQHLEDRYQELVGGGATEDEARRVAREELSDENLLSKGRRPVEQQTTQESIVSDGSRGNNFLASIWQDICHGSRQLRRNRGFAAVAVLTLALGIGANTAIFSVVNAVLLRPLPYPQADRLDQVMRHYPFGNAGAVSATSFVFWREHNRVFSGLAAYDLLAGGFNLTDSGQPEHVAGIRVSADFFRVLGVSPVLGRDFSAEEQGPGGPNVVMISDGLWKQQFGGKASIIGEAISLSGKSYTVVGVMPSGFECNPVAQLWLPLRPVLDPQQRANLFLVVGRLRPHVTLQRARIDMARVGEEFRQQYPNLMDKTESVAVENYQKSLTGDVRPALLVLMGAVGLVLLIACANVANLLLTRAISRDKEIAIRTAMGAGRSRLVRQLLTESVMLALAASGLGLAFFEVGLRGLLTLLPGSIPQMTYMPGSLQRIAGAALDSRVLIFTLLVAFLTGIVFGLAPAFHISGINLNDSLREGGGRTTSAGWHGRLRSLLVIGEISLSLLLLAGATLLIKTFVNLRGVDPGFDPQNVVTMDLSLTDPKYNTTVAVTNFFHEVVNRVEATPGVEKAAFISSLPMEVGPDLPFQVAGRKDNSIGDAQYRVVTPGYFDAMKIVLLQGRTFRERDGANSAGVVIINQTLAHDFFAGQSPVGQHLTIGVEMGPEFSDEAREIVGVVGDTKEHGLDSPASATVFIPWSQLPDSINHFNNQLLPAGLVVRTRVLPMSLSTAIAKEVLDADSAQPVFQIQPLEAIVGDSVARQHFDMILLGIFATLALLLASVGLYGLISYSVAQRTHEIGIRLALGAHRSDVLKLVVGQGLKLTLMGVGIGVVAGLALTRLLSGLLYGVKAADPATFIVAPLILTGVALLASYIPARRAARVDPMVALRYE